MHSRWRHQNRMGEKLWRRERQLLARRHAPPAGLDGRWRALLAGLDGRRRALPAGLDGRRRALPARRRETLHCQLHNRLHRWIAAAMVSTLAMSAWVLSPVHTRKRETVCLRLRLVTDAIAALLSLYSLWRREAGTRPRPHNVVPRSNYRLSIEGCQHI